MINVGDHLYVLNKDDPKNRSVLKVKAVDSNGNASCQQASVCHIDSTKYIIKNSEDSQYKIIANLGKKPILSSIDGYPTASYKGKISSIQGFDAIWFFIKPTEEQVALVKNSFKRVYDCLATAKLDKYIPNVYFEIHSNKTKKVSKSTLGMYNHKTNQIYIILDNIVDEDALVKTALHEFAHYLHFKLKDKEMISLWTESFSSISSPTAAKITEISNLVEEFLVSGESLSSFCASLDNYNESIDTHLTARALFKKYVSSAARYYKLTYKDLKILSKQHKYDALEKILNKNIQPIVVRLISPVIVSEYAATNLKEYFAEVLSYYLSGQVKVMAKDQRDLAISTINFFNKLPLNLEE